MHLAPDTPRLKSTDNKDRADIRSFYHLAGMGEATQFCQGTACFVARHLDSGRWQAATTQEHRLYCLGSCFVAPASSSEESRPKIAIRSREPIVLGPIIEAPISSISTCIARGGYQALEEALNRPATELVSSIEASGLRGRGGAGFLTGKKWRAVAEQKGPEKFVVANADEGDPGAYIDRFLLEGNPHRLLEALAIAGYAIGATKGYVYLRKEYPDARIALERALLEARRESVLGERVLRSDFAFDVELVMGQGSYVCGEETALLNSIEGHRPEVRLRPPYPSEYGLFGKPTLINNVETLANIPWIVRKGADAFRRLGFSNSHGTKVLSLNSLFRTPGLYEVEFGISIRDIVEDLGGGLKSGILRGVIVGGPLAGIIPPDLFDTPLGFEELARIGASVGHGGVVAFDEHTSIAELIRHIFDFAAYESCGKCTPCRLGSRRIEQMFKQITKAGHVQAQEKKEYMELVSALAMTSLCGLGTGLAEFARSAHRHYADELEPCFR
jgi:NADH:ubiquinone oxidoreductase subunit F (NADH-binding)